jgi:hypothetical protein
VAMGYRYKDGVIYMTYYGKAQKVVNVRRNPKVGVMVEVGERYAENTSADSLIERRSGDEGFSWPRLPGKFPEIA